ncbi:MAG: UDP-3-O-(3-hydroxymyristoyl)glucosamine N-acyltransferase [Chitinophagaceae bacterium]|nr:MAG: UDP-3-O-(3-hydroxymyristoyl)glucosamine N-acyltransferase [Chitinophagaceae bacterium]
MQLSDRITLKNLADLLGAKYTGNEEMLISGLNEIHKVQPGDLTFVDFDKYYNRALNSKASAILINKEIDCPDGKALIFSDDPFRDFNKLTHSFRPFKACNRQICNTAVIGENTIIQPGVFVGDSVEIGKNCVIHANVTINNHTKIGDNVIIHSNTVLGADAFYYKKRNNQVKPFYDKLLSSGRVIIQDNVEIGASCTIDRGVSGDTIIGKGTKIDNLVHVGHGSVIGENCLFAAHVGIAGKVMIEDDVILWGQVGVSKDLTIGKGAVVYAQSGVSKSLKGGKVYFGSPAQEAKTTMREMATLRLLSKQWNRFTALFEK